MQSSKIFLYPDMAQIEARAVAVLSNDAHLIEAFTKPIDWPGHKKHGQIDSHTRVVQLMLASGAQITRDQAKRLTYAAMYGGGAAQVAQELNAEAYRRGDKLRVTTEQVQFMLDTFFRVFHGVRAWQHNVVEEVARTRQLVCPKTGRRRTWLGYLLDTRTKQLKNEVAKEAWSFLPQNMAAWILGLGLLDIYKSGQWGKLLTPLIHVHDALLIEAPFKQLKDADDLAIHCLTRYIWGMHFPAEMKHGWNWQQASCAHRDGIPCRDCGLVELV